MILLMVITRLIIFIFHLLINQYKYDILNKIKIKIKIKNKDKMDEKVFSYLSFLEFFQVYRQELDK